MRITPLGNNQTELYVDPSLTILFSYKDPVAARLSSLYYVIDFDTVSTTTARHIENWLDKQANYKGEHITESKIWFKELAEWNK